MASPAKLKKVADSATRGKNHLPGSGVTAGALKKPNAAPQSGKKGKFPEAAHTRPMPLRSNGKAGSAPSVGAPAGLQPKPAVKPMPLRSGKSAK